MGRRPSSEGIFVIYCRLSRLPSKQRTGRQRATDETVARQEQLCRQYAAEQGWLISERIYRDNGRSAWKRNGKRPEWDAMVAEAREGKIAGIIAWKLDRFARNMRDATDLAELAKDHHLTINGPSCGEIDVQTSDGEEVFYTAAVAATTASTRTSERVKPVLAAMARDGWLLGGGRMYGFEITSEVIVPDGQTAVQRPDEVAIIREAGRRMLEGESLVDVAVDLNARGCRTVRGGLWRGGNLGRLLGSPRYGGYVLFHDEIVGRIKGEPPVFDEITYNRVQAKLATRRRGRRPRGLWKLTGAVVCGRCGGRMVGGHQNEAKADGTRPRRYICPLARGGCSMSILADKVEEQVQERVVREFDRQDLRTQDEEERAVLTETRRLAYAELDRVAEDLGGLYQKRAAMGSAVTSTWLARVFEPAEKEYLRQLDEATEAVEGLALVEATVPVPTIDNVEAWDRCTGQEQRELLVSLGLIVRIRPLAANEPRNVFVPERITIEPPEEAAVAA